MQKVVSIVVLSICFVGCENKSETAFIIETALGGGESRCNGTKTTHNDSFVEIKEDWIGTSLDKSDREALLCESLHTLLKIDRHEQLDMNDIKNMSRAGISTDSIIGHIESSGTKFHLTTSDIINLKNCGISQRIIDVMLRTGA